MISRYLGAALLSLAACDGPEPLVPNAFADGFVAAVDSVNDRKWPDDVLRITSAVVSGDTLIADVSYAGGCRTHRFALLVGSAFMESHPVQLRARIAHDAGGDACEALLTRRLRFDLTSLRKRYRSAYGAGPATIVINLTGYDSSLRYRFE